MYESCTFLRSTHTFLSADWVGRFPRSSSPSSKTSRTRTWPGPSLRRLMETWARVLWTGRFFTICCSSRQLRPSLWTWGRTASYRRTSHVCFPFWRRLYLKGSQFLFLFLPFNQSDISLSYKVMMCRSCLFNTRHLQKKKPWCTIRLKAATVHGANSAAGSREDYNKAFSSLFVFVTHSQKRLKKVNPKLKE